MNILCNIIIYESQNGRNKIIVQACQSFLSETKLVFMYREIVKIFLYVCLTCWTYVKSYKYEYESIYHCSIMEYFTVIQQLISL